MTDSISIDQLDHRYGTLHALRQVSLRVATGSIHGLIGLNGAGKTTLIKCLLDLLRPDAGQITLAGKPHHLPSQRQQLHYLPEKFVPSSLLKGHEYLRLTLDSFHLRYQPSEAEKLAETLALRPSALSQSVASYSKGMGQKLGLLGVILAKRPLWILDEPMSGLDPEARFLVKQHLRRHTEQGGTIFFSSHILADLDELCDDITILHRGDIRFKGSPQRLKQDYTATTKQQPHPTLEEAFLRCIGSHAVAA